MSNIEKLQEELSQSPELQKKIDAEAKRIAEHNEAAGVQEAIGKAIRTVLNIELTQEELDTMIPQKKDLSLEDMEQVSGGGLLDSIDGVVKSVGFAWDIFLCQKLKTHDYVWRGEYGEPVKRIFTIRYEILRCSRCGKAITGSEYKWVGPNG